MKRTLTYFTGHLLSALLLSSLFSSIQAQNLIQHIPRDASIVIGLHIDRVEKKVDMDRILELPVFKNLQDEMARGEMEDIVRNPAAHGLNLHQSVYFFMGNYENLTYFSFLLPLSDGTKFGNFVSQLSRDTAYDQGGYQVIRNGDEAMAWTDNMVLFMSGNLNYSSPEMYGMEWDEIQMLEQQAINSQIERTLSLKPAQSITTRPQFMAHHKRNVELSFWADSYVTLSPYEQMFRDNPETSGFYNALKDLYKDNYASIGLSLQNGQFYVSAQNHTNARLTELATSVNKTKINRKFARYLKQDDLLGYYAFAFNTKNFVQAMEDIGYPILDSLPQIPTGSASAIADLIDIFIDEDALYDLFPGNMMIAVTGVKNFSVEYTSYEYDEDFNRTEVKRTREEQLPEFTVMLSTKNEEDMGKIFRALEKVPEEIITHNGRYFIFPEVAREVGFNLYLAMANGIVFLSNNQDLIENRLNTGYPSGQILAKANRKQLKKFNQAFYWDMQGTMDALPKEEMGINSEEDLALFDLFSDNLGEMWAQGASRKDPLTSEMHLTMADPNRNILDQVADLTNEIYLIFEKQREERRQAREELIKEMEKAEKSQATEEEPDKEEPEQEIDDPDHR